MRQTLALIVISSLLIGCSGSDGSGGSAPIGAAETITVGGSVSAPAGAIAFDKRPSFGDISGSEAYAAVTGLLTVPDGTIVQLGRFNATGTNVLITSTTTTNGRYSFNLTTLGLEPSHDLMVQVSGPSGKLMRAFVVGSMANISPTSEAACQLVLQAITTGSLANVSLQEVSDIAGAIELLAITQDIGTAVSIDQAVTLVKTAVAADTSLTTFIAAAAQPGNTSQGASDIGNFFPFDQGSTWRYRNTKPIGSYETTVAITGQGAAPINGVTSTISNETNPDGTNQPQKSYGVKDNSGITSYGNDDPTDNITLQLAPYRSVRFPLTPGTTVVLVERSGLNFGEDLDGDRINETFGVKLLQEVVGMEAVTVPAGTFPNSLRIEFTAIVTASFSRTGGQATVIGSDTVWQVSGVGTVKEVVTVVKSPMNPPTPETRVLVGYVVNGQGSGLRLEVNPNALPIQVGKSQTLQATVWDANGQVTGVPLAWQSTDPTVATVGPDGTVSGIKVGTTTVSARSGPLQSNTVSVTVTDIKVLLLATNALAYDSVSGKLFVSMGTQGQVAVIDPVTGSLVQSVQVGNEPGRLTVSNDGQFLYVSIDNESTVKRLTLPTLATDLTFSLSEPNTGPYFCAKDMRVVPGNARAVVIVTATHGINPGACLFDITPYQAALFQDGIKLPNTPMASVHGLEFSDSPSLLFGVDTFSPGGLSRISVTASGLSLIDYSRLDHWPGREVKFLNGLIYTQSGHVYNGYTRIGSFTNSGVWSLRPDPVRNRLFAVTSNGFSDSLATIQAFDPISLTLLGSVDIPNLGVPAVPQYQRFTDLVRWGTDGLAFRTSSNEVVILRSPLVGS
jgi:hypothetical protein